MAYNSQDTSNSYSQYNNISMPIQPQQGQPKEKIQQSSLELEKRQKKIAQNAHKRKPLTIESERDKQKAELEKSGNELKSLLAQFGTKAKVADDIESDAKRLRSNIEALMAKAQAKVNKPIQVTPPPPQLSQVPQQPQPQPQSQSPAMEQQEGLFTSIWNSLLHIILFPFNLIINLLQLLYNSINWTVLLSCILLIELIIIGLIWSVRRSQYTYAYVEPYEAVVHGTFGVEQNTWGISTAVNLIHDFIAEVMNGGRGFGSPSYDGFVPI
ncbi:hypothetical protein RhiirA5_346056 [Rhizophagus irregularis]|uniref:Uncharacterized protein n=2 Tax=Rhizophagus irregularis TaxID=588596 RepID=A0A2I1EBT5_9GLOM|nr:hypothetical protein GLOIN_2v1610574 [Rhizophagus irregularis DAOM 181602=DAOM 197198]PKC17584.1 hypothetical protein RhiirA5_346056 [Rhizophagus irregularis]PKC73662.1 hypothetical protein RhiirA1_410261 [Rhizophagus irregularis]PKY19574.1 hypothetical protein RhiirB3_407024 [Rhizophagus irregularis]POG70997.1 hypothetical protein GLOIN_2v1610574 [Rhizophagus irregularis DAOM 181602=DAOM 197198]UZO02171.1 hypothetical protein OCT59_020662 [Rhizophagus irregularis]|eukprot:XP_025177863.1 hypothetical protein GLOIN_2v1610574 [Rhizophagus irregularis DAOM 181602=DAOM 197198]